MNDWYQAIWVRNKILDLGPGSATPGNNWSPVWVGGYVVRREGVEDGEEWRIEEGEVRGGASEGNKEEWKEGKMGRKEIWGGREVWKKGRYLGKGGWGGMRVRWNGGALSVATFVPFIDTHGHQFFRQHKLQPCHFIIVSIRISVCAVCAAVCAVYVIPRGQDIHDINI